MLIMTHQIMMEEVLFIGLHIKDMLTQSDYFFLEKHPRGDKIKKVVPHCTGLH